MKEIHNKTLIYAFVILSLVLWHVCLLEQEGWIACGGEEGVLRVIKLDSPNEAGSSSNMNQVLEGHHHEIVAMAWNENFRKLTTSDSSGLVIVWSLIRGVWSEEMVNNRNKSFVSDLKWSNDGQRVCIVYDDGSIVVGSVDGQKLWGKELNCQLCLVEWTPSGKSILFGSPNGDVQVFGADGGEYSHRLPVCCFEGPASSVLKVLTWKFAGNSNQGENSSLLVLFENGRGQIMADEADEDPLIISLEIDSCFDAKWSPIEWVFAVSGFLRGQFVIQFYSSVGGEMLRNLSVPSETPSHMTWEGSGLRMAFAVGSQILFATIGPNYLWTYAGNSNCTLAIRGGGVRGDGTAVDERIVFWNVEKEVGGGSKKIKEFPTVFCLTSLGNKFCVLSEGEEIDEEEEDERNHVGSSPVVGGEVVLSIFSSIAVCLEKKTIAGFRKGSKSFTISSDNQNRIAISDSSIIFITSFSSPVVLPDLIFSCKDNKLSVYESFSTNPRSPSGGGPLRHQSTTGSLGGLNVRSPDNIISAFALLPTLPIILVIKQSGNGISFPVNTSAPTVNSVGSSVSANFPTNPPFPCLIKSIAFNCNSTRLASIDVSGVLSLFSISISDTSQTTSPVVTAVNLGLERKDVWQVVFAEDNEELLAVMEKGRMFIYRGINPEEPVISTGWVASFRDLQVKTLNLQEISNFLFKSLADNDLSPGQARQHMVIDFETKSLRDSRDILTKVNNFKDALVYIESNPHPRVWKLLADSSLERLDLVTAEKAFVKLQDYSGIQFIKRLKLLDDERKQKAEICKYFNKFDEAETLYKKMDRSDLAIDMRVKVGDWFRVVQLAGQQVVDNQQEVLTNAWSCIGDYYFERSRYSQAAQYYSKGQNSTALAQTYIINQDLQGLRGLISQFPEGPSSSLSEISAFLANGGICDGAVEGYIKCGEISRAIDTCVFLNQWDLAIELANRYQHKQVGTLLSQYATYLIDSGKRSEAVLLYMKAKKPLDAARLIVQMARSEGIESNRVDLFKKMFLLAALETEKHREMMFSSASSSSSSSTTTHVGSSTLAATAVARSSHMMNSVLTQDQSRFAGNDSLPFETPWLVCEAYHLYILAHRQLYSEKFPESLKTALRLTEYVEILLNQEYSCLGRVNVWSLVCIAAFRASEMKWCNRAFIRLEGECSNNELEDLACKVFRSSLSNSGTRENNSRSFPCPGRGGTCRADVEDWRMQCRACLFKFPSSVYCVNTGESLIGQNGADIPSKTCEICKHRFSVKMKNFCFLCQTTNSTKNN